MDLEIGQIVSQIFAFLIVLWVMKRYAWKPLLGIMEERKKKIQSEFDYIDEQKNEIKKTIDEYHEKLAEIDKQAKVVLQNAVIEGRQMASEIQKEAHHQSEALLVKTQEEIQNEIGKAKVQLKNDLVDIIIATTQKVIQTELDSEKQKKLVAKFIDEAKFK